MALIKAKAKQTTAVERVSEGADVYLKALRDGSLTTADFFTAMSLEGRVKQAMAGTFTAPITFTAGAIVATHPDVAITVPTGTTMIPVEISLQIESIGTALILEILASAGNGVVTTAGTSLPVKCLKTDGAAGVCTAQCTAITAVYHTDNYTEFWRTGEISALTQTHSATVSVYDHAHTYAWKAKNNVFPVVVGPANVFLYVSTQAGTGFWDVKWIELPTN